MTHKELASAITSTISWEEVRPAHHPACIAKVNARHLQPVAWSVCMAAIGSASVRQRNERAWKAVRSVCMHYTSSGLSMQAGMPAEKVKLALAHCNVRSLAPYQQPGAMQVAALFAAYPFQPMHVSAALGHLAKLHAMAAADAQRMLASALVPRLAGANGLLRLMKQQGLSLQLSVSGFSCQDRGRRAVFNVVFAHMKCYSLCDLCTGLRNTLSAAVRVNPQHAKPWHSRS
jgi:hypothetical protein